MTRPPATRSPVTRVLMTADAVGGVWTYVLELADALAAYDVDVDLAVLGPPMSDGQRAQLAGSAVRGVHERAGRLEWMTDPWPDVDAAGEWLVGLARDLAVDVVHLSGYAHAALSWAAPVVVVAHSDVVSWWRAVHGARPPATWDGYVARVAAGLEAADAVVAPTRAVLDDLAASFGVRGGVVVGNCRRRAPQSSASRSKERLVLGAGRVWDEAKNLRALQAVAPRLPWPVAIAGDTGDLVDAQRILLGRLDAPELAEWLDRAAVFAAPARYEPFGLGVLEAAQAGCALVLGDIPSLREVWDDAALYVDPHDDEALARALLDLCDRPERVSDLGRRARARSSAYLPERTAAGYLDVYRRLLPRAVPA